jgi:exodeoxyribonuclease-3
VLLATWNVNSVKARLERLLRFLERRRPDVVCLQELKVEDDQFPREALEQAGYHAAVHGQKAYNGVAILSREEPRDVLRGMDDGEEDPQARLVAATVRDVRVLCAYVPNGQAPGTPAFAYKLRWFERLRRYLERRCDPMAPVALCGDFNVAPDDRDVYDPVVWKDQVLCHPEERKALAAVTAWGLVDLVRKHHPGGGLFTWWDYRMLAFPKNRGLRIDHVFATEPLARRSAAAEVDRQERKGEKPSDHAPVLVTFE